MSKLQSAVLSLANFRALDPFPSTIRRSFRYADLHQLATETTTGYCGPHQRYSCNSLYDPNYTGGGHQPYGYDQLTNIYSKYRVDRVTFRITYTTPGGSADIFCAAAYSAGTSLVLNSTKIQEVCEWPNAIHGHLSSSGPRICVLTGSIQLHELLTVSKVKYESDDTYSAAVTASPTNQALLVISVGSYSGASAEAASVLVELEYDAVLFDRQVLNPS